MKYWIDAQLPPALAVWLCDKFNVDTIALRDIGLRDAEDAEIFEQAKLQNVIVITKDSDFIDLVLRLGAPPKIIWITCGNTTNNHLRHLMENTFEQACQLLIGDEIVVEIGDKTTNK